jgi:hypothetical protein
MYFIVKTDVWQSKDSIRIKGVFKRDPRKVRSVWGKILAHYESNKKYVDIVIYKLDDLLSHSFDLDGHNITDFCTKVESLSGN